MKKDLQICFFGAYDRNYTSNRLIIEGLRQNGVKVVEVNADIKLTRLDRDEDMSWWKLVARVVRKYRLIPEALKHIKDIQKSDAIFIGFPGHFEVFPAFIIAKLFKKKLIFNPLVIFYTGYVDDQGILKKNSVLAQVIKTAEKLVYSLPDIILADTPFQKEHICREFGISAKKVGVLPIGADDKVYPYSPKTKNDGLTNIMYYGLYTPIHGIEHIVQAANILKNHKDIVFTMVGKGHTFEENYESAQKLGLKNIRFYPDMMEDTALSTLAEGDIFLGFLQKHPTVDRVVPNKVYQGLALGKAVISADAKVIRSIFTHKENIYLCKPSDPKSLAEAILYLHEHKAFTKAIGKNGYELYKKRFTPNMVGKELADIANSLIK